MIEFTRTDWDAYIVNLHADAFADPDALSDRHYCIGERIIWQVAVKLALQSAENATAIAIGGAAMRDARFDALEARIQYLERAHERTSPV